ncbi:MAG: hypothetical protein EXS05_03210 [Planctomycetaceae bacterium]|nr:hypothetical protein [Planctomycetaceae bacterium]
MSRQPTKAYHTIDNCADWAGMVPTGHSRGVAWALSRGWLLSGLIALGLVSGAFCADPPPKESPSRKSSRQATNLTGRTPTPLEDDAALHDVQFVSKRLGWAVGDHGVIWHTRDGGEQWTLQTSGVNCPLFSICFLTDRVGWAAGGGTMPFTHLSYGVLLHTTDGGQTWESVLSSPLRKGDSLPRLTRVKFFSADEGIAAGQGTDNQPGGVYITDDGGKTWRDLAGQISPGWLAADFLNRESGVVAGPNGRVVLVNGERLTAPRVGSLGLRSLRDVTLAGSGTGWLVGDAGLVLRTENTGLVWEAKPLPEGIRDACDFNAVCCRGPQVWVAGEPGSVIWHSTDSGDSWDRQATGQSVPLHGIHFVTDERGCAVGALGLILRTDDGGQTWQPARGAGRRLAVMMLYANKDQVSLKPIAELSGDSGYRSLVSVVAGEGDLTANAPTTDFTARLSEAVILSGGSAANVGWRLPLDIPGLERNADRLVAEWNRRTEGHLEEVLVGGIVRQLRTWRPSLLILEHAGATDALTILVNQAAMKAVDQAGDSTSFLEQHELGGLDPWQVEKVFRHLPPGSTGTVHVEPHRYLERLQKSVRMAAAPAEALLAVDLPSSGSRDAYRLIRTRWDERQGAPLAGGFFAGLALSPGTASRRRLAPIDERQIEARQQLVNRQRNFEAATEKSLADPIKAGQLIAHLGESTRGMPDSQAAVQLAELAERYQQQGQWELAELALVELTDKYPEEPAALRGMQRLVQSWASAEVTWRRLRKSSSQQQQERTDPARAANAIVQAQARLAQQEREENKTIFDPDEPQPSSENEPQQRSGVETAGYIHRKHLDEKVRFWQSEALRMAQRLESRAPQLAAAPEVQFPLAALRRRRGAFNRADDIYRRFVQEGAGGGWSQPAETEFWLTRPLAPHAGPHVACFAAAARPVLDGVLADDCWKDATEIPLTGIDNHDNDRGDKPLVMLCYDDEFLYLAARLPRVPGVRKDAGIRVPRRYDEDLTDFDRLTFHLDTDRDRVTCFSFSVDQRGCTSESCWHDRTWNPRWMVAVDADDQHWRVEAAIAFDELMPKPPEQGAAWGVGLIRTVPAVGWQSWTRPAGSEPRPETFGLVRFE